MTATSTLPTLAPGTEVPRGSLGGAQYAQPVFGSSAGGGTQVDATHGLPVNLVAGGALGVIGAATAPLDMMLGGGVYRSSPLTLTTGQSASLQLDAAANLKVVGAITANAGTNLNTSALALETGGNLATLAGTVSAGKIQATIASALPAGSAIIGNVRIDQTTPGTTNGVEVNASALPAGAATAALQGTIDATLNTINATLGLPLQEGGNVAVTVLPTLPAGSNAIGKVSIDQATPGTTNGVVIAPSATVGIAPTASTAAEGSHVLKIGAGTLYTLTTTIGAASGWIMLFDATSAPGDGAVLPLWCKPVLSNGTAGGDGESWSPGPPQKFSTGITVAFSLTGCFTKTTSATAFFSAQVQ